MAKDLDAFIGKIHHRDCLEGLLELPAGSIDLVFADPPFNIGYEYDEYDDRLESQSYIDWCNRWMAAVHRALKPQGAFWLAIGDEYAAELKLEAQKVGFHLRNWVIWYYTFGVHCKSKFTRSHAHLFYFVNNPSSFTFNFPEVAVFSARQLVYNDKRANTAGRSPDDTWFLRPQDCMDGLQAREDTWYFPRVAGTFKERAGFHGCQMPEQLLARIIRTSSNPGEIVVDPFSGSSTTLAVAKKLGRLTFGFELSKEYVDRGTARLSNTLVGDPLDGAEEPRTSVPSSFAEFKKVSIREPTLFDLKLTREESQLVESFKNAHRGYSVDRLIVDPWLNADFQTHCDQLGISGTPFDRNRFLLRLNKAGRLDSSDLSFERITRLSWDDLDGILHASEIAWERVTRVYGCSLDELLCDPRTASEFDSIAQQIVPGRNSLEFRWGAIKLRKEASIRRRNPMSTIPNAARLFRSKKWGLGQLKVESMPESAGVYVVGAASNPDEYLYIGETLNLSRTLASWMDAERAKWSWNSDQKLTIQFLEAPLEVRLANQMSLLKRLNGASWNATYPKRKLKAAE